jgi:formate dehydrogenase assembly factor FdhD
MAAPGERRCLVIGWSLGSGFAIVKSQKQWGGIGYSNTGMHTVLHAVVDKAGYRSGVIFTLFLA